MGEASLDELDRAFEGDVYWGEEEMDVVWHDDEGVEFVVAFAAVVVEGFYQELGCGRDQEECSPVVGLGGDGEGAVACCPGGDSHRWPSLPQRLQLLCVFRRPPQHACSCLQLPFKG